MILNVEQKAERLITYSIAQAGTLSDAIDAFNSIASTIKQNTYEESASLIDQYLAWQKK